jgi:ubiquinone/menaquinone biosynthesis C-methylase UbiE
VSNNYIELNREAWNRKTGFHVKSKFYDNDSFINGKSSLNDIELKLLGDVSGKTILHLQCHFGQDTLSLQRLGGHSTGVDFSDAAVDQAKALAEHLNLDTKFVCCDLYELPSHLNKQFEIVFTSYGTVGWLPDLNRWANVVERFLKPGGKFVMVDFHPVVWMFDSNFSHVQYSYFNKEDIVETETGTYADRNAPMEATTISWNHSLGEIIGSLLQNGLTLQHFDEHDSAPYNCLNGMIETSPGKFQIESSQGKLPLLYSIVATK